MKIKIILINIYEPCYLAIRRIYTYVYTYVQNAESSLSFHLYSTRRCRRISGMWVLLPDILPDSWRLWLLKLKLTQPSYNIKRIIWSEVGTYKRNKCKIIKLDFFSWSSSWSRWRHSKKRSGHSEKKIWTSLIERQGHS